MSPLSSIEKVYATIIRLLYTLERGFWKEEG